MAKKRRVGEFPQAFWQMAVERLKQCDNISALAKELGVHRRLFGVGRGPRERPCCGLPGTTHRPSSQDHETGSGEDG